MKVESKCDVRSSGITTEPKTRIALVMTHDPNPNHSFHDVIYRVAGLPMVERLAKGAR